MYTYKEKKSYELNRRTDRDSQKQFFSGAINRMKLGTDANEIYDQKEFACDVLCTCGFCLHVPCEKCALEANYRRAMEEIAMGERTMRKHVSYEKYTKNTM